MLISANASRATAISTTASGALAEELLMREGNFEYNMLKLESKSSKQV